MSKEFDEKLCISEEIDFFLKVISEVKCSCAYIGLGPEFEEFSNIVKQRYIPLYNKNNEDFIIHAKSTLDIESIRKFIITAGMGFDSILFLNGPSIKDIIDKFNIYAKENSQTIDLRVMNSVIATSIDFFCSIEKECGTNESVICIAEILYDIDKSEVKANTIYRGDAPMLSTLNEKKIRRLLQRGLTLEKIKPWVSENMIHNFIEE